LKEARVPTSADAIDGGVGIAADASVQNTLLTRGGYRAGDAHDAPRARSCGLDSPYGDPRRAGADDLHEPGPQHHRRVRAGREPRRLVRAQGVEGLQRGLALAARERPATAPGRGG